jgi:hypothetical protein
MRRIHWLAAIAVASMLTLGGCKGEQGTPKGLLEKMHEASEKMDAGAMVECMEPEAQKTMKDLVPVMEEMQEAAKEAAAAVEKKIGKDEAKPLLSMAGSSDKSRSPLKAVVKDGKVDWSKVNIKEDGEKATVEVDGKKADVDLKKVDGKWYVAMPETKRPSADESKKQVEQGKKMVAAVKELTKKVNDGKVTKENWTAEFSKAMSGM